MSRRYEKGSIVLTSNGSFAEWGKVFADPVVADAHAALLKAADT